MSIDGLIEYALERGLINPDDRAWAVNSVLEVLQLDSLPPAEARDASDGNSEPAANHLAMILDALVEDAATRGLIDGGSIVARDLFDTAVMGRLTPPPREVHAHFSRLRVQSPQSATEWFYRFSQDTNYIRRDRMAKDVAWTTPTEYGTLDITINLAKPEKDPRAIAASRNLPSSGYPQCLLCVENEGYAGRLNHPARQNHRTVPVTINDSPWFLQYSPYVYYNEHSIVFNARHTPMQIDRAAFAKLLDFVGQFPHYFVGSNADLPIVGGSILAHDHFQGGRFEFAMERAPIERSVTVAGFDDVDAGIVRWPMSVLRLRSASAERLTDAAEAVLAAWRGYTDESAFIFAQTHGEPHNTITPIARRRGDDFELDLVLRNNITTDEHPMGVYHPHQELHHIKKENIGLIEVMGLAVLPARLVGELDAVAQGLVSGADLRLDPLTEAHAEWAAGFANEVTAENAAAVIEREVGKVFATVLEHAGVFARSPEGQEAFDRFVASVNAN